MKKILGLILLMGIYFFASCTQKTDFDDKTIARIETTTTEGFYYVSPPLYKRVFNFIDGTISDITIADECLLNAFKSQYIQDPERYKEYDSLEKFDAYLHLKYNTLKEIATFKEEDGKAFLNEIISLGIYTWKESYITDDVILDASGVNIKLIFTDETEKNTYIYFKNPKNYNSILTAFKTYFEVSCWNEG